MRTEKVKLFGTYFFCVLQTLWFSVRFKTLIINALRLARFQESSTFATVNDRAH